MTRVCGGCEGKGAHWRWCPESVGPTASRLGQWADAAEALGDSVGPNSYEGANGLWRAAAILREEAGEATRRWRFRASIDSPLTHRASSRDHRGRDQSDSDRP